MTSELEKLCAAYHCAKVAEAHARDQKNTAHEAIVAYLYEQSEMAGKIATTKVHPHGILIDAAHVFFGGNKIVGFYGFALKRDGSVSKNRRLIYVERITSTRDFQQVSE